MSQFKTLLILGSVTLLTACGTPNNGSGSGTINSTNMGASSTDINGFLRSLNTTVSNNGGGGATSNPSIPVPSQPSSDVVQILQQVGQLIQQSIQKLVSNIQPNETLDQRLKDLISSLQNLITQIQALNTPNLSTDAQTVLKAILNHLNRVLTRLQEFESIIANLPNPPPPQPGQPPAPAQGNGGNHP